MSARTSDPAASAVGGLVAEARRAKGLSQGRLGELVFLDRTAVSKIESGRRKVGSDELARIARTLGRPIDWFLADRAPRSKQSLSDLRRRRRAILRVAGLHGATSVRVFGSVARGEARTDSDVDLLVELERGRSLLDQAALVIELRDLLGRDVDVVTRKGLHPRIRGRVLREAVPL